VSGRTRTARSLGLALAVNQLVGTVVALRYSVPGRPLGVRFWWGPRAEVVFWGTGISAPLVSAAALGVGAASPSDEWARRILRLLGASIVVGQLVEPVNWERQVPGAVRAVAVANLVLAPALVAATSSRSAERVPSA
jgi:hypothetical protein